MIHWIVVVFVLVAMIPAAEAEGEYSCLANETEIHISNFQGGRPRPGTVKLAPNTLREEFKNGKIRVDYFLDGRRPFRVIFRNLTFSNAFFLTVRSILTDGTKIEEDYPNVPPVLTNGTDADNIVYVRRLLFIVGPDNPSIFTFFTVVDLRVCIEVLTGGPLPSGIPNPCMPAGSIMDFFHPLPNNLFIQCDAFGNAFLRPCAFGTVWDDSLSTCVVPSP